MNLCTGGQDLRKGVLAGCADDVLDGVVDDLLTDLFNGGCVMEIMVNAELKKVGEYLKKDKSTGYQIELYVDGDRGTVIQALIAPEQKKDLLPLLDKKIKAKLELSFFDGRPNYKYKGIAI